jgi:hypothetical protein
MVGPVIHRHSVTCKFMWPYKNMPDPVGAERLLDYGCKISYEKSNLMVPRKIHTPGDFRPGTKKGKIDAQPIWLISITIPKKLMQDIYQGQRRQQSEYVKDNIDINQNQEVTPSDATQEILPDEQNTIQGQ